MNISFNWLKQYVDLPNDIEKVSDRLTMLGFEVDGVEKVGSSMEGIVIGEILEVNPHPNADKLNLCQVQFGSDDPVQIVCGAPNVAAGHKVPVATVGTVLSVPSKTEKGLMEEITLKKAKLRGEESNGMICSEAELGISEEHDGIMVLDVSAESGSTFADYLSAKQVETVDHVYDVALTPNRPDGTSHIGVARDLASDFGLELKYPEDYLNPKDLADYPNLDISIEDADGCHRYIGIVIEGIKVAESPSWLKSRLHAIGLRPINNIVDITNYVMYESGQPLHAFDLSKVADQKIVVRSSNAGEKFTTLDEKERELPDNTLMICDGSGSVAIAGIMGGLNSEVGDDTVNILLEAAYFDPSRVRRAAKLLSMQTDASYRFERGVDPESTLKSAMRAASLMEEIAGGEIKGGKDVLEKKFERPLIDLRPSRVAKLVGFNIETEKIVGILNSIELKTEEVSEDLLKVSVPGFRPDIEREIDLIEEVIRLYGYENVELPTTINIPATLPSSTRTESSRTHLLQYLAGRGFRETYTNSLVPLERGHLFTTEEELVTTVNPISRENAALRPSMLSGMLPVVAYNKNRGGTSLRFMEFGYVFSKTDPENKSNLVPGYYQREVLGLIFSGIADSKAWNQKERKLDLFDVKKEVSDLLRYLGFSGVEIGKKSEISENGLLQIRVHAEKKRLGSIGVVGNSIGKEFDSDEPIYFAELEWSVIGKLMDRKGQKDFVDLNRFPSVNRDIAVIVENSVRAGDMLHSIKQASGQLLDEVSIFDIYKGENLGDSRKSVAFSLTFTADKTLQDKEVDKQVERIIKSLKKDFSAELRS